MQSVFLLEKESRSKGETEYTALIELWKGADWVMKMSLFELKPGVLVINFYSSTVFSYSLFNHYHC